MIFASLAMARSKILVTLPHTNRRWKQNTWTPAVTPVTMRPRPLDKHGAVRPLNATFAARLNLRSRWRRIILSRRVVYLCTFPWRFRRKRRLQFCGSGRWVRMTSAAVGARGLFFFIFWLSPNLYGARWHKDETWRKNEPKDEKMPKRYLCCLFYFLSFV